LASINHRKKLLKTSKIYREKWNRYISNYNKKNNFKHYKNYYKKIMNFVNNNYDDFLIYIKNNQHKYDLKKGYNFMKRRIDYYNFKNNG
jgi:hypothetical protein